MRVIVAFLLLIGTAAGCRDWTGSTDPGGPPAGQTAVLPPSLSPIPVGSGTARIWAYVSHDLSTEQDPVNLIISGTADPRAVRNALLALNGNRDPVFPAVFPFSCTWSDAIGGLMAGFAEVSGWTGGAVQLQCGSYGPIRFHLRLFKAGGLTIANAHFEVLIPGTTDHQVLSWELAEQLVAFDLARTGLLGGAPGTSGPLNAAPFHRDIPAQIYNGLPVALRSLIGGPLADVSAGVGIANDGQATLLVLAGEAAPAAGSEQRFELQFNQLIPKPFCAAGPGEFLLVQGPVALAQEVRVLPGAELQQHFRADGRLSAVPVDLATLDPIGAPLEALVSEQQDSRADAEGGWITGTQLQQLLPAGQPGAGQLRIALRVSPRHAPSYDATVTCH